jgi:hypothetical protein
MRMTRSDLLESLAHLPADTDINVKRLHKLLSQSKSADFNQIEEEVFATTKASLHSNVGLLKHAHAYLIGLSLTSLAAVHYLGAGIAAGVFGAGLVGGFIADKCLHGKSNQGIGLTGDLMSLQSYLNNQAQDLPASFLPPKP